jgi:cyclophilin family peptidyl-prolyl cis-trans isomerase
MSDLQRAQQRKRRNTRTIPIIFGAVLLALLLAFVTGTFGGSSKKSSSSTSTTSTTAPGPSTTLAATADSATVGPGLVARAAPAVSAVCTTPASGATGTGAATASGKAVSIVPAPAHVPFPNLNGTSPRYTKFSSAPPFCINAAKTYTAAVQTDIGTFTVELLPKYAPVTVNNFVFLAGYHYFEGTVFHRVIPGFMNQGGDPTATGDGGPGYQFKDELPSAASAYGTGSLAMANAGANTNGSQFFVVVPGGGAQLSPSYSVFGQVTSGMNIVEKINSDGTSAGTPNVYHKIIKVTVTES